MKRLHGIAIGVLLLVTVGSAAAQTETTQKGQLRVAVGGEITPSELPRTGAAPIAVAVSGRVSMADGSTPPELKAMRIDINRYGRIDHRGLPVCEVDQIQPASSARALAACRSSLVGQGRFWVNVVLSGEEPYPTQGRLLVFNGRLRGRPVLLGQIYSERPFATSFVIPFAIRDLPGGTYGTALTATFPRVLGNWGYLTGLEMNLFRRYGFQGVRRSYVSASCPAPEGLGAVGAFPLMRTSFSFVGGKNLTSVLTRRCEVRG